MQRNVWAISAFVCLLTACGSGGGGGSGGGDNGGSASGDLVSLTANVSDTAVPAGTNTDLEFVVANPGSSAANNVTLSVTLGAGLTRAGVQCSASNGAMCPLDPNGLSVSSLPAGGSLRFRVSVIPASGTSGVIASAASVTAANDSVTSNNSVQVNLAAYSADVSVVGSTDATDLFSGRSVPYSFTVSNAGPDAARNLSIASILSSGQSLVSLTCSASDGAICPATSVTPMIVPTLPSGGALSFALTAQMSMDAVVSVSNTVSVTALGDPSLMNNAVTTSAATRVPTSPDSPTFVILQSDQGDYIGGGTHYSYSHQNAVFELYEIGGILTVRVRGDESWDASFSMAAGVEDLRTGRYEQPLDGVIYNPPTGGGLRWGGEARGCRASGWFIIDDVVYAAGELASVDLRFEQHCEGLAPALRGQIHWVANDETRPPGPVNPPPEGLWAPAPGATPASGNYLYIESDVADFVGQGRVEAFTQANSVLTVRSEANGELGVNAIGDRSYGGGFIAMSPLVRMEPGYYPNAQLNPFGNPSVGRFRFTGESRGCNDISGWFVVDTITFSGDTLTALDLRFEQHCEGVAAALRGQVHWRAGDPTQPPGPQVPPPANLWSPPAGAIPATGNVAYIQSESGDFVGGGLTATYTPLNSVITPGGGGMVPVSNRFQLTVQGDEHWTGYFQAMNTLSDLRPGYYGNLMEFPNHNPVAGGVAWSGEGRACGGASGWFVIDSVTYSGNTLQDIQLRFEQRCWYSSYAALRGLIRWSASDTRQPPPPQNPPPSDLWTPPLGATPATGNYVYFQSEAGEFIGAGQTWLYTGNNANIGTYTDGSQFSLELNGTDQRRWSGYFIPMVPLSQLQVGYYGDLTNRNIAKGLFRWGGDGRGCNRVGGWFVVDAVTYVEGAVTSIELRFEQHCEYTQPALRGKIRWSR